MKERTQKSDEPADVSLTSNDSRRGRNRNSQDTIRLTLSTTERVITLLEKLAETGLYGKNTAETAERLITESLLNKIRQGEIVAE